MVSKSRVNVHIKCLDRFDDISSMYQTHFKAPIVSICGRRCLKHSHSTNDGPKCPYPSHFSVHLKSVFPCRVHLNQIRPNPFRDCLNGVESETLQSIHPHGTFSYSLYTTVNFASINLNRADCETHQLVRHGD